MGCNSSKNTAEYSPAKISLEVNIDQEKIKFMEHCPNEIISYSFRDVVKFHLRNMTVITNSYATTEIEYFGRNYVMDVRYNKKPSFLYPYDEIGFNYILNIYDRKERLILNVPLYYVTGWHTSNPASN